MKWYDIQWYDIHDIIDYEFAVQLNFEYAKRSDVEKIIEQRNELLEACKILHEIVERESNYEGRYLLERIQAVKAINKAEADK